MKAQWALIAKAKESGGVPTFVALSEKLGVTPQTVQQWRVGSVPLSDERIEEIAGIAGEDPGKWKLAILSERTKSEAIRRSIRAILEKAGMSVAVLALCAVAVPSHLIKINNIADAASAQCLLCY